MQKLLMVPSSCYTLEITGLLLYKLDQTGKELQKHLRSFSLCCREQWSRPQIEEGSPLYVSHLPACLQTPGQRSSQLQVGWGRAHCCAEAAKLMGEKPTRSFCQPPSQLVVKTGREEEKHPQQTACALFYSSQLGFQLKGGVWK